MANPKTTVVGITRDAISLTAKGGKLLLRATGKALALGHQALDHVQDGYQERLKQPKQLELDLRTPPTNQ